MSEVKDATQLNLHYFPNTTQTPNNDNNPETQTQPHATNENITPLPENNSVKSKFAFLLSKEFLKIFLLGQFLSLCITATILTSRELAIRNANIPTTQTFLTYVLLLLVYTPITLYKLGFKGYWNMLKTRAWKCKSLYPVNN